MTQRDLLLRWHGFVLCLYFSTVSRYCQDAFKKFLHDFALFFYVFIKLYFFALPDGAVCVLACVPRALLCLCRSVHLPSLSPIAPSVSSVGSAAVDSVALPRGRDTAPGTPFLNLLSNENNKNEIIFGKGIDIGTNMCYDIGVV